MLRLLCLSLLFSLLIACGENEPLAPSSSELQWIAQSSATNANDEHYEVGYDQVSSNNQDPWVRKTDASGNELWRLTYETTGVDGRAILIALDEQQRPWVVFTVDGGSNSSDYITQKEAAATAFDGVLFAGYGRASGAAKVSILTRLNPDNGQIERGTFLLSRTNEGNIDAVEKTNTFAVQRMSLGSGAIWVEGHSWFKPAAVNSTSSNFLHHPEATEANKNGNSYWTMRYRLKADLSGFLEAEVVVE